MSTNEIIHALEMGTARIAELNALLKEDRAELDRLRAENDRLRYDRLTLEGVTEMLKQEKARAERAEAEILERAAMMREVMRERDALAKDKAWLDWLEFNGGADTRPEPCGATISRLIFPVGRKRRSAPPSTPQ